MGAISRWVSLAGFVVFAGCGGGTGSTAPPVTPPSGLSYASPQTYYVGTAIQNLAPAVTGTVTNYSISPPLPAGLTLNSSSGVISGTPAARSAATVHTVTAVNAGGQTAFGLSIAVYAGSVELLSGDISRTVVSGTSVSAVVQAKPNFAIAGTLYAAVSGSTDSSFQTSATVTPGIDGIYTIELTTSTTVAAGAHAGAATAVLCEESTCQAAAPLALLSVPFSLNVMTPTSAWPGNHLTSLSDWPDVPEWTMYQGNAAHTGYVPVTLNPDRIVTRWQRSVTLPYELVQGRSYKMLNSVVTSGGLFYDVEGKCLLANSEHDGSVVWQHDFSDLTYPSTNPPSIAGGVVYTSAGQQSSTYFFGFDAASGAQLFRSSMSSQWERYLAPTIGPAGVYTNAGAYGGLYGFDAAGSLLFSSFRVAQWDVWTPAVDSSAVYAYTGGRLQTFDPTSGTLLHTIADPAYQWVGYEVGGSPVLGEPGMAYLANYEATRITVPLTNNALVAIDAPSELVRWQVAGAYPVTPAYRASVLYAPNVRPLGVEARAEATGALNWSWIPPQAGDNTFATEVLVTDNLAFVCTNLALYAIDLETHKTVWSYPAVGRLALSARGVLYVAGVDTLTAFNVK